MTTPPTSSPRFIKWPCWDTPFALSYTGIAQRYRLGVWRRVQPVIWAIPPLIAALTAVDVASFILFAFSVGILALLVVWDHMQWIASVSDLVRTTRENAEQRRIDWLLTERVWDDVRTDILSGALSEPSEIAGRTPAMAEITWPLEYVEDVPPIPMPTTFSWSAQQLAETEDRIHGIVIQRLAESGFDGIVLRTVVDGSRALAIGSMAADDCQIWLLARVHITPTGLAQSVRTGFAFWVDQKVLKNGVFYRGDKYLFTKVMRRVYLYGSVPNAVTLLIGWLLMHFLGTAALLRESLLSYNGGFRTFVLAMMMGVYLLVLAGCRRVNDFSCIYSPGTRQALRRQYANRYPEVPGQFGDLSVLHSSRQQDYLATSGKWAPPEPEACARAEAIKQQLLQLFRISVAQSSS